MKTIPIILILLIQRHQRQGLYGVVQQRQALQQEAPRRGRQAVPAWRVMHVFISGEASVCEYVWVMLYLEGYIYICSIVAMFHYCWEAQVLFLHAL